MSSPEIRPLQNELLDFLESAYTLGSFATKISYSSIPNPCLDIEGYGTIGLPLSHHDAQGIIQRNHKAHLRKGEETLVDTSARKTWEIEASKLTIKNPAWSGFVAGILEKVIENLGVEVGVKVRTELSKLLLYEEGCGCQPHIDTEKLPGMIATLILSLPSQRSGGVVQVSHGGETIELDTDSNSEFNLTALAWYADVKHEVSSITQGYRLVLTYNLIMEHSDIPDQSVERLDDRRAVLPKILHKWLHTAPDNGYFVFLLEYQYPIIYLNMVMLKGCDEVVVKKLRDVCSSTDVYLFLANLEHEIDSFSDYDYIAPEEDCYTHLDNIVTLDGIVIGGHLYISEEIILQENAFPDDDADSEDEDEATAYETTRGQRRFHRSVSLMFP